MKYVGLVAYDNTVLRIRKTEKRLCIVLYIVNAKWLSKTLLIWLTDIPRKSPTYPPTSGALNISWSTDGLYWQPLDFSNMFGKCEPAFTKMLIFQSSYLRNRKAPHR